MRILLSIITCFVICLPSLSAQEVEIPKDESGNAYYSAVVNIPESTSRDLFIKANEWIALTFKSANDVIQLNDEKSGKIIGKGSTIVTYKGQDFPKLNFTIKIEVKDNRYRYIINNVGSEHVGDIGHEKPKHKYTPKKMWDRIVSGANKNIINLIASLELSMKKNEENDEW